MKRVGFDLVSLWFIIPIIIISATIIYRRNPILLSTIKIQLRHKEVGETAAITGVTVLRNELFIATAMCSDIEVYDASSYDFQRRLELDCLTNPQDMQSCAKNDCLYIFERTNKHCHSGEIVRIDYYGALVTKLAKKVGLGRIFVTDDSNIILTVFRTHTIYEYSPSGCLIREVNLSLCANIFNPIYSIKLASGNFLVSDKFSRRVHMVDSVGQIVCSSTGHIGKATAMHADADGSVIVVDRADSRILLLSSDLQYKREIVWRKHGLRHPATIYTDASSGRLCVADNDVGWKDGRLLVFHI